jgi:predicted AAA+ superfamily ATPase
VPEIFTSLKAAIDTRRTAGRFILTGSANVLLVPRLADSLAGRMEILRLHPLSQCEIERVRPRFLDALFAGEFATRLGTDSTGRSGRPARRRSGWACSRPRRNTSSRRSVAKIDA